MRNRTWIITVLVIIGLFCSACIASAAEYSYVIQDGNDNNIDYSPTNTISYDNIESDDWYNEYDDEGYYWSQDTWRYIVFGNNVTVREAASSNERVAVADKSYEYNNVVDVYRTGGGSCTVRVRLSTGDWLSFKVNSCKTPFEVDPTCILSNWYSDALYGKYNGRDASIFSYEVEDPSIVRAEGVEDDDMGNWSVILYGQKPGTTRVSLTAMNGEKQTVTVTVKKEAFNKTIKGTEIFLISSKTMRILTAPLATVKLKVNGKTYKLKANYKGEIKKKFSKKVRGKKFTATVKSQGYTKKLKGKLY